MQLMTFSSSYVGMISLRCWPQACNDHTSSARRPFLGVECMEAVAPQQISFEGRISIDNSNAMRNRLGKALKLKPKEIDVDLSRVTSIDISGLATLVEATRIARDQGTRLRIGGIQGQVQLLFAITHIDQMLD